MTRSKAHRRAADDPFSRARATFEQIVADFAGRDAPVTEWELEKTLTAHMQEIGLQLLEARFDVLLERERLELLASPPPEGTRVRVRSRQLETEFGRAKLMRHGFTAPGEKAARFPTDEQLNLPTDLYSHSLRERVLDEARRGAWDQAVEQVDERTGGHVPKRQAEDLAVDAAQDFEAFYAAVPAPVNDTLSAKALLVASSDSKGIRMRPEALRDATRKAAEQEQADAVRGDPMAARKLRQHDKRMAIVTAVWEQEPHRRTAQDIIDNLRPTTDAKARKRKKARKARAPRPQGKRLVASVEKSQAEGISEMFDELDRRDPDRQRPVVMLIDGEEHQRAAIIDQECTRGRNLILVLDIIHALSYLWRAGFVLCQKKTAATEIWVIRFLVKLLTRSVETVIADIQRAVAQRRLSGKARTPVDDCIRYFTSNTYWMRYPEFLAAGYPIATGVIEGACRHLVQDRMGITGASWGLAGAEAILKLRALRINDDWNEYWRFHRQNEAARNYARAA